MLTVSVRNIKSLDYHNLSWNLEMPVSRNYDIFISLIKGLQTCPLRYAISATPVVSNSLVVEFWLNSSFDVPSKTINSMVRNKAVSVTVQTV
jgi:hypothetical protein